MIINIFNIYNYQNDKIYYNTDKEKKRKWQLANNLILNNKYNYFFFKTNAELYLPISIKNEIIQKILNYIEFKKTIINIDNNDVIYHIMYELYILYNNLREEEKILIMFYKLLCE
jgi:hypothetical protein